jgi:hypothetical protein
VRNMAGKPKFRPCDICNIPTLNCAGISKYRVHLCQACTDTMQSQAKQMADAYCAASPEFQKYRADVAALNKQLNG